MTHRDAATGRDAVTDADPAPSRPWSGRREEAAVPVEPDRPGVVELAAAILIASGVFGLVRLGLAVGGDGTPGPVPPAVVASEVALQVITIVVGVLVRTGRSWVAVVNVVAVLAFVQFLAATIVSVPFAILYVVAFVLIYLNKRWFDARSAWRRTVVPGRA